jgi:hypothetical protein
LIELRDLKETVSGSLSTIISALGKNFKLADLGSAFLNKKFGWDNLLDDIDTLLFSPEKVANKVNYLISRQWKDTTFRTSKYFLVGLDNPPAFAYNALDSEYSNSTSAKGLKTIKLSVMVNCNVRFPELLVPKPNLDYAAFQLRDRIGGRTLTLGDLYRLIPWTWLGDWFDNVSQYLDCIETVNADDSIINYAFASYHSEITSITEYNADVTCTRLDTIDGVQVDSSFKQHINHSSLLLCTYRKRKDLATADRVRPSWDLTRFSGSQLSILAALAAAKRG